MNHLLHSLWAFLFLMLPVCISAQTVNDFHNISVGGNSMVFCIQQDADGVLWVGGERGLFTYDGYALTPRPLAAVTAYKADVNCLCIDGRQVYVGTSKGLWIYDRLLNTSRKVEALGSHDIRDIKIKDNNIYVGHLGGITVCDRRNGQWRPFYDRIRYVFSLCPTKHGWLVGTIDCLYLINNSSIRTFLQGKYIDVTATEDDDHCWVGIDGNLFLMDLVKGTMTEERALHGNSIKRITHDHAGRLIIGTDNGLYIRDHGTTYEAQHDSRDPSSLGNNVVWSVYVDRWNNLWMGTDIGISVHYSLSTIQRDLSLHLLTGATEGNLLKVMTTDRQNMWLGGTNGLIRLGRDHQADWFRLGSAKHPISHNRVRSCYVDADGDTWITTDNGINRYDARTGQLHNYLIYSTNGKSSTRWAYSLLLDRQHRLWVGAYDEGVFIIDKDKLLQSSGRCIADYHLTNTQQGITSAHVTGLVQDHQGNVWVAGTDGLDVVRPNTYEVRHVSRQRYTCMVIDDKGAVWTGDRDGNLHRFILSGKKVMTTDYPANHLTGAVAGIVPLKGNLYAFSDHICRIITARGQIEALRLPVSSVSGAGYDALRKEFVLLGHDRISTIRSRALAKRHSPVPLLLSSVRVNDSIDWQAWHNATEQKTLKLHHNENDFVFSFTDLPYADRMRNVYAYRLKGLEEAWHPLGDDMQTAFTRVPAGDYELEVAVVDGLSRPVDIVYHVVVEVLHPWYATTWMKLLYAALVMFLIWTGYRGYRHFSSLRREKHLHDSIVVQMERRHRYIDYVAEELKKADAQILMALQNFSNKDNTPQQRYAIGQIRKRAS